jgi:hypothetical protein
MKSFILSIAGALSLTLAHEAMAAEVTWELIKAQSTGHGLSCADDTVQMGSAGQDMSLAFQNMTVNMPANGNVKTYAQNGTCFVFIKLTVPKGYSLSSNSSSLFGGVTKDVGTVGYIDLVSTVTRRPANPAHPFVGLAPIGPAVHIVRSFAPNVAINEPLLQMSKTQELGVATKNIICSLTKSGPVELGMFVQLSVAGARAKTSQTNIIAVDNIDSHLNLGLTTAICPKA